MDKPLTACETCGAYTVATFIGHPADEHAVVVRPGDKLVIHVQGRLDQQHASLIKQRVAGSLPGVEAVLIDSSLQVLVYQPGETAELPGEQQAPELIIEAEGSIPPEAAALIRERAAAIKRDPRVTLGGH